MVKTDPNDAKRLVEDPDGVRQDTNGKPVLQVNGVLIRPGDTLLVAVKVNDIHDQGNIQVQLGDEHATPSVAALVAACPSSAQASRYASVLREQEELTKLLLKQQAADADAARAAEASQQSK